MTLPKDCPNPFLIGTHTDDNVTLPPGNIPDFYADILRHYREALVAVRQHSQSLCFSTIGSPGTGKSNLIAQFWHEILPDQSVILLPLRLSNVSSKFIWQPLRAVFFSQLLNPYPIPSGSAKCPLTRIIQNRIQGWSCETNLSSPTLIDIITGRSGPSLKSVLERLSTNSLNMSISAELIKLIPMIVEKDTNEEHTRKKFLASAWLRGSLLSEKELKEIDVSEQYSNNSQRELQSEQLVTSILHLAGRQTIIVLCFDEIEAIQAGREDVQSLVEFMFAVLRFLSIPGPRLIMLSIRPGLALQLTRLADASWRTKTKYGVNIRTLSLEQVKHLVRRRLEDAHLPASVLKPGDLHWPPGSGFLEDLHQRHPKGLTPRFVLTKCAEQFNQIRDGTAGDPPPLPPDPYPQLAGFFLKTWQVRRAQCLQSLEIVDLHRCVNHALPWLAQVEQRNVRLLRDSEDGYDDIDRVFVRREGDVPRQRVGVASCHHEPRVIWRRFQRLAREFQNTPTGSTLRLYALRPEWNSLSEAAQSRLDTFLQAGGQHYPVSRELAAEWSAYDSMLQDVQTGSLVAPGVPVIAQKDFDRWVSETLSPAVRQLMSDLFDPLEQAVE